MAYNKNTWSDGPGGGTPLSAARLNKIEDGIAAAAVLADVADGATPTGAALRAASVAASQTVRNARESAAPTFYRANGGQPVLTVANQNPVAGATASATLYIPWVIDARKLLGAAALDEFYMYNSTDHASVHTTSGAFLYTAPTLLGPWTGRGRVFRDDAGGTQTETPAVFADPTGEHKLIMLYQQMGVPGAVGGQTTLWAWSDDGLAWTRGGIAIDIPTWWPSDGHTGYARPQQVGGKLMAYHLAGGWDYSTSGRSQSWDGRTWWMDQAPLAYEVDMFDDGRHMSWIGADVVYRDGAPWAISTATGWNSGDVAVDARLIAAPLSTDLRRVIGKPTVLLYPTQGAESTNYKGKHVVAGRDGYLYLFYNCGGSIFVATTKEP